MKLIIIFSITIFLIAFACISEADISQLAKLNSSEGTPEITLSTTSVNFGNVTINRFHERNFTIQNDGDGNLIVSNIISYNDVISVNPDSATVYPGDSLLVTVTLNANEPGNISSPIGISSNDNDEGSIIIYVNATVVVPDIVLLPSSIQIDDVALGGSNSGIFKIFNDGVGYLYVSEITSNNNVFEVDLDSTSIAYGDSKAVEVTFTPTVIGPDSATIFIISNDLDEDTLTVKVKGTGINPEIALSTSLLEFGNIVVGNSELNTFTITNEGSTDLIINSIISNNEAFLVSPDSVIIAPEDSQVVTVTFRPMISGIDSATITIINNDFDENIRSLDVKGTGLSPEIMVSITSINIGDIDVGSIGTVLFTISNGGDADLIISNISSDNSAFTINPSAVTIAPNNGQTVTLKFRPTNAKADSAIITIISNDIDESDLFISVKGTGIAPDIALSGTLFEIGNVPVDSSGSITFTIINEGNKELVINNIISSNDAFTINPDSTVISSSDSQFATVTFSPIVIGEDSTTITIVSNDLDEGILTVSVKGTGIAPDIALSDTLIEIGYVVVGNNYLSSFTIYNEGNVDLIVSSIISNNIAFTLEQDSATITSGDSMSINVTFSPIYTGIDSAIVTILSNDLDEDTLDVMYIGNAYILEPPLNVKVADFLNDQGHCLRLTWTISPSENLGLVNNYRIYRSRSEVLTDPIQINQFSDLDTLISWEENYTILIDSTDAGVKEYIDNAVPLNGVLYYYWVQSVGSYGESAKAVSGTIVSINGKTEPCEFCVFPPYPNPFNYNTTIKYSIPNECNIRLIIYDILGNKVRVLLNEHNIVGQYSVNWDGRDGEGLLVASGVYLHCLKAGNLTSMGKILFIK